MKESKVFEVPMDQIKMEVTDCYELDNIIGLVETIARNAQTISELLTGTAWWDSFNIDPHDRQNEIIDMAWEAESLRLNDNFDEGFYGVEDRLFGSHGIDLSKIGDKS